MSCIIMTAVDLAGFVMAGQRRLRLQHAVCSTGAHVGGRMPRHLQVPRCERNARAVQDQAQAQQDAQQE